jgi:lipopolysaccharide/colanic/teichoic acid biosynthesis glycosyltransferase
VSPLLLLAYVMIRLDSPGPVIYMQERVGQSGKIFNVFKFRSMRLDAEKHSGPVLACEQDPRITKIGQFLRASRIDELPQLLNVMLGEMSFVGPRPERLFFVEQFAAKNPNYLLRLNVKPGITGLAQIWGKYSTAAEDKLRLDLIYTANYSPILDLNIIIHTLRVVLLRANAEGIQHSSDTRLAPDDQVTPLLILATAGVARATPPKDC